MGKKDIDIYKSGPYGDSVPGIIMDAAMDMVKHPFRSVGEAITEVATDTAKRTKDKALDVITPNSVKMDRAVDEESKRK